MINIVDSGQPFQYVVIFFYNFLAEAVVTCLDLLIIHTHHSPQYFSHLNDGTYKCAGSL